MKVRVRYTNRGYKESVLTSLEVANEYDISITKQVTYSLKARKMPLNIESIKKW